VSRYAIVALSMYIIICAVCLFLPDSSAVSSNFFWMLGPPANLIYGLNYLLPFLIGTVVVGVVAYGMVRTQGLSRRLLLLLAVLLLWSLFGFIVYAPTV